MRGFAGGLLTFLLCDCAGSGASANVHVGADEELVIAAPAATPAAPEEKVVTASVDAGLPEGDRLDAEIVASIREVSPSEHLITAPALSLILVHEDELLRRVRFVPDPPGGRGVRVFGVRADGVLAHLGLQNGDLLLTLMQKPTRTDAELEAAYRTVAGARRIPLDVDRSGAVKHLLIRVE